MKERALDSMAAVLLSPFSVLLFARISAILVAFLVITWALHFQTSFIPLSPSQEDLIYAVMHPLMWKLICMFLFEQVMHPLLMVIGFILISGEAILVYRWLPGSRNLKKSVHLCLQGVALGCGIFGIWTKFHGQDGIVANFYSLHSWLGLICISMFGAQWLFGFMSFWHNGEVRTTRLKVLPWHVFLGLYTYGLAVVTAETGLLEKLTLLQANPDVTKRRPESSIVNGLGLSLVLLSGAVIFTAVLPKHQRPKPKVMF